MESNLALVYTTLNMIYIILIITFNVLFIHIITFNNFLLTRQRLKRLYFLIFLVRTIVSVVAPSPHFARSYPHRHQRHLMFIIVIVDQSRFRFNQFYRIAPNSLIWLVRVDLTPVLSCRINDGKDQFRFEEILSWHTWRHVVLPPRFGRVEQLCHVNLIKNNNVGNVYTDN